MEVLLTEATRLNLNWTGTDRFGDPDIVADPALAHYTRLRPERGDFGLVAEVSGRCVGVVWLLFLDSGDPGYGFVADGVPELSVCVWPGYRGVGIGRLLLDEAFRAARSRGIRQISLSVEDGNPARMIYVNSGFHDATGTAPGTMVVDLRP
ncbi:MAG TPA: GNAT family N-acetyltransferase [Candidatus Dietzia intestinigallinarum]|nr:GNAT family N-acetyltransferase [Candidatus Dietzia intestinigallinarum]